MDNKEWMEWQEFPLCAEDAVWLAGLKIGDHVLRLLGGVVPMSLVVTAIKEDRIVCGEWWEFDPRTGGEIDERLGWHAFATGSFIRRPPAKASER